LKEVQRVEGFQARLDSLKAPDARGYFLCGHSYPIGRPGEYIGEVRQPYSCASCALEQPDSGPVDWIDWRFHVKRRPYRRLRKVASIAVETAKGFGILVGILGATAALAAFGIVIHGWHIEQFVGGAATATTWLGIFWALQRDGGNKLSAAVVATLVTGFLVICFINGPSPDWPALE
jgi:hypothetical protein